MYTNQNGHAHPSAIAVPRAAHQRNQQRRRPRLTQERMREQFRSGSPLYGIPHEHAIEEVLQPARHLVRVLQLWRRHVPDSAHRLQRRLVEERRLAVDHLDDHDSKRPDVHLRTVRKPRDDLGRHPVRRADQRFALGQFLRNLRAKAEIGQLHPPIRGQQDRVRFDVPMDYSLDLHKT